MKYTCCLCIILISTVCLSDVGQSNRGNLTAKSYEELSNLRDILQEQQFSGDKGFEKQYASEYLNNSELNEVVSSSESLLKSCSDLIDKNINKSKSSFEQGKYNESLQAYDEVARLIPIADGAWSCKCYAIYILEEDPALTASRNYSESEKSIERCTDCDYNAQQDKYEYNSKLESIKENMEEAKAKLEEEKRKGKYLAEFNASGINISSGLYESYRIFVPLGDYEMSFLIRTIGEMSVHNYSLSRPAGSGKTYHINNFTVHTFDMENLDIDVAQYTGSAKYIPEDPFDIYESAESGGFTVYSDKSIKIDGTNGQEIDSYYTKNPDHRDKYTIMYQLDKNVFVKISSRLDFDKDGSLLLETFQIAKRSETAAAHPAASYGASEAPPHESGTRLS